MSEFPRLTVVNIGTLSMNKFWKETERVREASATCVVIEVAGRRLIVDPSPHPEQLERLLFERCGLRPRSVDEVFLTHRHGDHRFGLPLFEGKPWFMARPELEAWRGTEKSDPTIPGRFEPAEDRLPGELSLVFTPGHTATHHSLQMPSPWGPLVVAGDAVMTPDFWLAEEGYHNSVDFEAARDSIRKLKKLATVVIPGHGNFIINLPARQMRS
jgi:glyoxylase-like metal-dependent hydrolase (beta-lactamase superfamily II)